ncbi:MULTISPECIES: diacylglycerol kinase family protein [Anoxybacillus]|jgi:undecaprenol kinase|uniref:Diacylglycerol kinase family protein n=1 Tax=Anoxybacteroides rupiense TaxID=311460 RepID=A0ABD5ISD9_9BACL|nr:MULTISPECIES: diacylglycerol kinase family protein [Anoxybacillus]MBB3906900.1 undecaprenol kinase [Anoxybacillus rupiensis]MBS2769991.1 diacylglycerol kinase family protein [Anoxybacillus rupiensis]MDE8562637.1 diacylglycerol kinase family protein [Anoxybacillus rupiensis]MED5050882.1 diacylglycerol kinase family protein [Anoxybacillus rupiensis]QHC04811.1 diacylglycerol kinase family protein [Anoxybacillus sp. PDR2]
MKQWRQRWKRFRNAWSGMVAAVREEVHMKIHLMLAAIAIVFAIVFHFTKWEWLILLLTIGAVISLEMVNTAIERTVDLVTKDFHPLAKAAKDIAAGAVLLGAIMAVMIGAILFLPHLYNWVLK